MSAVDVLEAPGADGAFAAVPAAVLVRPSPVRSNRGIKLPRWARRMIAPLVVLGLWQLVCSEGLFTPIELASPIAVVNAGRELWAEGQFQSNLLISLERVAIGLSAGLVVGLTLSLLSGLFHWGEDLIDPLVQAFRSVPILGLLPLVIIWFGIGELPKYFLIALGMTFTIYINTYGAIRGVDMKLIEAGKTFGLNRLGLIRRIILPGSLPGFLVGLRLGLVHAWLIIVVAEQINAKSGIGYLINQAQTWGRTDIILLGCTVYAVLGLIADFIVRKLERGLLSWRRGFEGA